MRNASDAIEFYKAAFGAAEEFRLTEPSARVGHTPAGIMTLPTFPGTMRVLPLVEQSRQISF